MDTSFQRSAKATDEWYTPPWIIQALGDFDLNPCAPTRDHWTAASCYTKDDNGLRRDWFGRVFLNPPYSRPLIVQFVSKLAMYGDGIALLFNRMDTALWHDVIFPSADAMLVMRGRLKFIDRHGHEANFAGCSSVLVAWGGRNAKCLERCSIPGKFISLKS